jgi:hypothetical protein
MVSYALLHALYQYCFEQHIYPCIHCHRHGDCRLTISQCLLKVCVPEVCDRIRNRQNVSLKNSSTKS